MAKFISRIKSIFKDKIKVYLIIKGYNNDVKESYLDAHIDSYLKTKYFEGELNEILKNLK